MEVAFAGRSNVGKSSLINALTGRNALARTSHTPGRTQELIFFEGPDNAGFRLVDMPGYGYASAPKAKVASWTTLIHKFLQGRASLARVYVLIDARHGIKDVDLDVLKTLDKSAVSYQVVLTKADQVKPAELEQRVARRQGRARQTSRRVSGSAGDILAHRRRHAGTARRDGAPARASAADDEPRAVPHPDRAGRRHGRRRRHAGGGLRASAPTRRGWRRRRRCCCFTPPRCSAPWRWPSAASSMPGSGSLAAFGFVDRRRPVRRRPDAAAICRPRPVSDGRADRRHAADRELAGAGGGGGLAMSRGASASADSRSRTQAALRRCPPIR